MIENSFVNSYNFQNLVKSEQEFSVIVNSIVEKIQESIIFFKVYGDVENRKILKEIKVDFLKLQKDSSLLKLNFIQQRLCCDNNNNGFLHCYESLHFSRYKSQLLMCIDQFKKLQEVIPEEMEDLKAEYLELQIQIHHDAINALSHVKRKKALPEFEAFQNKINLLKENKLWMAPAWYKFRLVEGELTPISSYTFQSVLHSMAPLTNLGTSSESKEVIDYILKSIGSFMDKGIHKEKLSELVSVICDDEWANSTIDADDALTNTLSSLFLRLNK